MAGYPKIGLIADTHELADPASFAPALAGLDAELVIHLGDVGSSPTLVRLVKEFKQAHGQVQMSANQCEKYDELIAMGRPQLRAYIESWIHVWPELDQIRIQETINNYHQAIQALRRLNEVYVIAGNVDHGWLRHPAIRQIFTESGVRLVESPLLLDYQASKILLWPSMKLTDERETAAITDMLDEIIERLSGCKTLVIAAHEQLFRGPPPDRYRANLAAAGLSSGTIPYYEPNPTRRHIHRLLGRLPADCVPFILSGHIHDRQETIAAGVGYLPPGPNGGLLVRTLALNGHRRRQVECFCLPAGVPALLETGPGRASLRLAEAELSPTSYI